MNVPEHLLVCLAEEGAEVSQICAKALRFGLDEVNVMNPKGPSNRERIVAELNDLMAVAKLCAAAGILPANWQDLASQENKIDKVRFFMDHARREGALT